MPLQTELLAYWKRHVATKVEEGWDIMSQTQMNFHENKTDMVTLDHEASLRDRLANEYLKPLCDSTQRRRHTLCSVLPLSTPPEEESLQDIAIAQERVVTSSAARSANQEERALT